MIVNLLAARRRFFAHALARLEEILRVLRVQILHLLLREDAALGELRLEPLDAVDLLADEVRARRRRVSVEPRDVRFEKIRTALAAYLAAKGSITVDGVSLTVNTVADDPDGTCRFTLNLIPHTGEVTTLGGLVEGDTVNLEIDVLARYLKRMEALRAA